ncbi:NAD(P)/FAD-dependent oxidoreductase [Natronococcus sp. A-GB7]|uniref:NAD(P)/FAD-dependent oxidoreductase n=1 Tax=Natronococcus sp. A-GB7 TaxID=3037649 RepID=UPI00241D05F4|nr:NAD(P)/FAD-dependent oxidoreductase [Natronococcus sp. A-GB7]MDG5817779.1 NAD(P)-binding domain-containing protein [Natronococcus sp. A-GB7]
MNDSLEVAVVGAGPAGIGTAVALERLDVDYAVLERDRIGASFRSWPEEMRLLTPSFPANAFGVRDLNAVTVDTSPALALDCEHPTGKQYAEYLEAIAEFHELPVETGIDVKSVAPRRGGETEEFVLETDEGATRARYVVWAAGQYQYPSSGALEGATQGVHVANVDSWAEYATRASSTESAGTNGIAADGAGAVAETVSDVAVVGGAESGIDAALGLAEAGRSVTVLDDEGTWQFRSPDPSEVLSPRTNERLETALEDGAPIELVADARVAGIEREEGDGYVVTTTDGDRVRSRAPPVLATGFEGSLAVVDDLFAFDGELPDLTDRDESTETPGLFLAGPQVAHNDQQFCFIYKFRQRFAVVAEELGERLGVDTDPLEAYREKRMVLEDLDCCEPDYCDC